MWPSSIAIGDSDKIYVSDEYSHKISIMTLEGEFISFGQLGNKDGQFDGPNGLIFDNKNQLYVVDREMVEFKFLMNQEISLENFHPENNESINYLGNYIYFNDRLYAQTGAIIGSRSFLQMVNLLEALDQRRRKSKISYTRLLA